jgi:hypothetical protein
VPRPADQLRNGNGPDGNGWLAESLPGQSAAIRGDSYPGWRIGNQFVTRPGFSLNNLGQIPPGLFFDGTSPEESGLKNIENSMCLKILMGMM